MQYKRRSSVCTRRRKGGKERKKKEKRKVAKYGKIRKKGVGKGLVEIDG